MTTRTATDAAVPLPQASSSLVSRAGALLVLLGAVVLYVLTMGPTVLWGDDAELQRIVVTGEPRVIGQSSSASHLLWLALTSAFVHGTGWLPLDFAGRTTLVTALFGAAAIALIYLAGTALVRPLPGGVRAAAIAGLAAAIALALSHTYWLLAVRPDVYTLQTALLAAAVWALLRWRVAARPSVSLPMLGVAAVAILAALANHAMILASLPGLGWLAVAVPPSRRRAVRVAILVFVSVAALALFAATYVSPRSVDLLRTLASFRPVPPGLRDLALVPIYLAYQFPLAILLAIPGVWALWRRDRGALVGLLLLYAANAALPLLVHVRDRFQFFLPSYVPIALLVGVGAAEWLGNPIRWSIGQHRGGVSAPWPGARLRRVLLGTVLLAPLGVYPLAALAGGALAARLAPARLLPGRDPVVFYLWPPKTGYVGARRYGEGALAGMAPRAAIVADWLPYETLRYLQTVEERRPDVLLANINAGGGAQLKFLLEQALLRPVYLADDSPEPYYEMSGIRRCFTVQREGVVYRLQATSSQFADCR